MLGTIMVANVLFVIIPAHRKLVQAMEEKREPDPGTAASWRKDRSVHNNYLTLPVLFTMLAGHFAFIFGADEAWLVFVLVAVLTAFVRVFFNLLAHGRTRVVDPGSGCRRRRRARPLARAGGTAPTGQDPGRSRSRRCRAYRRAVRHLPLGSVGPARSPLETEEQIRARADDIERQAVQTRAMPPGNATGMTDEERELLAAWIAQRVGSSPMLAITAGGFQFGARLEEEAAPADRRRIPPPAPARVEIIHVRWSGEGGWIPMGDLDVGIGPENATRYPSPGELIFYPGGVSETELLLAYGYVAFASKAGALAGNHFATIVEGNENLRELGRRMLWEGAQEIVFREA